MIPTEVQKMIGELLDREGGYVEDSGGPTRWGITEAVARKNGYEGDMRELPRSFAFDVALNDYYRGPGFDRVAERSTRLATELTDTGYNAGPGWATRFLQRALTLLNDDERLYDDISVDGVIGDETMRALDAFMDHRGEEGTDLLWWSLDAQQGCYYMNLAEQDPGKYERYLFGWLAKRTGAIGGG